MTLYEVGKIPAESLDAFLEAAAEVERPHELELLEYFDHAISLRIAAASLRAACPGRPLDIVRTESLRELGSRSLAYVTCAFIAHVYEDSLEYVHLPTVHSAWEPKGADNTIHFKKGIQQLCNKKGSIF